MMCRASLYKGLVHEGDLLVPLAGEPKADTHACVQERSFANFEGDLRTTPGRASTSASHSEADSTLTGTGARECSSRPLVAESYLPVEASGFSLEQPGMLSPLDPISSQQVQASGPGFGPSSPQVAPLVQHRTRLQHGINKPKIYMDGTIRYSLFSATGEPQNYQEALGDER
jgi:hypothetical protein